MRLPHAPLFSTLSLEGKKATGELDAFIDFGLHPTGNGRQVGVVVIFHPGMKTGRGVFGYYPNSFTQDWKNER